MSNFPNSLDDDTTLPFVNDNITEAGGDAINALRDAVFALEQNVGIGAAGTTGSIAARIGILINADGSPNSSTITSLGLVTLPITNSQISNNAGIPESKLKLDHRTQDLYNYIVNAQTGLNTALSWITISGVKLDPHITGTLYRHTLAQINVSTNQTSFPFLLNNLRLARDNSNGYTVVNDINNELLAHQWADGSSLSVINNIVTNSQSTYPSNFAHTASGVFLNTSRFVTVPQTANDMQQFAQFIDNSGIFLLGTRLQNLYSNGISKESRSSSLMNDGYGTPIVPVTSVIAYLKNNGTSSTPIDDINIGDDIIEFKPSAFNQSSNIFDAQFALVKIGDIVTINYGALEVRFLIREKKYIQNGSNKKYSVRIAGKNLQYSTIATARIDKPLVNNNKYGVLAVAAANNNSASIPASLIVGTARGAQILGIGFNPDLFDASHYLLYLALYSTGNPADGYTALPAVDVTGNQGATPGLYTLDSIVDSTNFAFRQAGYNYRFIAFQYQGEFGIMLADSYNNAGFSILNGVVTSNGIFDPTATSVTFLNNVVGIFPSIPGTVAPDPLGFGTTGANVASPTYQSSYGSAEAALLPTKIFLPLKRNNFYVNGTEREKLNVDVGQIVDNYGDGYWIGNIISQTIIPGPSPTGRVETTYNISLDLSASQLKIGKTIVVQSFDGYGSFPTDFGRFIIQSLSLPCAGGSASTQITVYDAVHGVGVSPVATIGVGAEVAIYFGSDSVSINQENSSDYSAISPFKRHIEVYVGDNSNTFTQERGRFYIGNSNPLIVNGNVPLFSNSELSKLNIIKISPKLRGYQFGSVNKITLNMISFDGATGIFDGYLSLWDGVNTITNEGPNTFGKKGEITRFYDETNIDYIDIIFDINTLTSTFTMQHLDIQLFPTLSLDNEQMLIATCQYNDISAAINYIKDERQFGNIGVKELSTSALQFLSLPERLLHGNGVIRGFDLENTTNPNGSQIYLMGGEALVNGNFIQMNAATVNIPLIKEFPLSNVNWLLCINQQGEYQPIPLLDFDPAINTPSNPNRLFLALNLVNGQTYNIDATTFSDLINKRKDLVPLYIVTSITVPGSGSTLPTITLTLSDTRKYVNDIDTNLALRLTSDTAQGNFRSPVSILNWIKYNNLFNGTAILGGANTTITTPVVLSFTSDVLVDGRDNAILTFNNLVTFGSNLTIKNIIVNFNGGIAVNSNTTNLTFDNCTININVPTTAPVDNVIFDMTGANKIHFNNCVINIVYASLYNSAQTFRGSVFRFTNAININFNDVVLDVQYNTSPGVYAPGNVFTITNSTIFRVVNSIFSGNFNQFVNNTGSSFLTFQNLIVSSTYNPNAGGSPDSYNGIAYSTTNLVNSGQGYIYTNVGSNITNIQIDNVIFNYQPGQSGNDRYSFINFELSTSASVLSDLRITNCKFNNLNIGTIFGAVDDYRAVIAIVNTAPTNNISTNLQPLIYNILIDQNVCNRNQSIIVTSTSINGNMQYPGLGAYNCSITNNVCGTIGYWVSAGYKVINIIPNIFTDKGNSLNITNNTCHYISNLDHMGIYFLVSKIVNGVTVNQSSYPSGYVKIDNNTSNWIHTGIAYEENSSLHITNNLIAAYDPIYLINFADGYPNTAYNPLLPFSLSNNYAIFVSANKHNTTPALSPAEGSNSPCIITGNVTESGYFFQNFISFIPVTYKYIIGYIYCQSSCDISGNILNGIISTTGIEGILILLGGLHSTVTNNKVYRNGTSIMAYVGFANFELPLFWNGIESTGIITDNTFDSPYINDISLSEVLFNLNFTTTSTLKWVIERNINQTGYMSLPLTNSQFFNNFSFTDLGDPSLTMGTAGVSGDIRSSIMKIHDNLSPPALRTFGWQENLDKYMPLGSRLINIKIGIRGFTSQFANGNFTLLLSKFIPTIFYINMDDFSSPNVSDPGILLSYNGSIPYTTLNVNSGTVYIELSTLAGGVDTNDVSNQFIAGGTNQFNAAFRASFTRINEASILFSPLLVKYRW